MTIRDDPERPETVTPEPERPETVTPTEETEKIVAVEETEELAHTGGSMTPALLGAGLLAGGAGLIIAKRRSEA